MSDQQLAGILYPSVAGKSEYRMPDYEYVYQESNLFPHEAVRQADALTESYRLFDRDKVSTVTSRQREDHSAYIGVPAPDLALQRPSAALQQVGPVADRVDAQAATTPTEAASG